MKILVTGAAGFIGSHLAERLANQGHEVIGLDAFTNYYPVILKEQNAQELKGKGVNIHKLNLAKDDLGEVVSGIEIVYHLAAQPGISNTVSFDEYLENNFIATEKLIQAVKDLKTLKFFINIGTSSIYGLDACYSEETAPKPASYYGVTKLAAEQLVLAYQRDKGMPACSFRLYSVYGPRERPDKLYPKAFRSVFTDYKFPYFEGSENHERSYTYVGDIVDGLVAALDHIDECNGQIFNLGTDKTATTGEALKTLEEVMGIPIKFERKPRRAGDQSRTAAVIEKARKILGYNPSTSLAEGLKATGNWFTEKVLPLIKENKL